MRTRNNKHEKYVIAVSLGVLTVALGIALHLSGITRFETRGKTLAENILRNTYNPWNETLTSYSLNAVSSVIWDIRGIDTLLETIVLFTSILGVTVLTSGKRRIMKGIREDLVAKITTKIVLSITIVIAVATALHGHLSPGGGFQAGVMLASVFILSYPIVNIHVYLHRKKNEILLMRLVSLGLIITVALIPVASYLISGDYAYIMQNQRKENSLFQLPSNLLESPLGGSILFFNLLEFITVFLALMYSAIILLEESEE